LVIENLEEFLNSILIFFSINVILNGIYNYTYISVMEKFPILPEKPGKVREFQNLFSVETLINKISM
jgi:hypothetical protein